MESGTKLDSLIAKKVFGHKVVETRWGKEKQYGCLSIGEPDWWDDQGSSELSNPVPYYSTDIAAAWLVVEKLSSREDWFFNLRTWYNDKSSKLGFRAEFSYRGYDTLDEWGETSYDSASHAICLAALKAV